MNLASIKKNLQAREIFFSEDKILERPTVIGYEKKFKWKWMATQLNTFVVASDFKNDEVTPEMVEAHLNHAFDYAKKNNKGLPRGFQSGVGAISILFSSKVTQEAKDYCQELKSGKKWAGFIIPVVVDTSEKKAYFFEASPLWGKIYFPHFKQLIQALLD